MQRAQAGAAKRRKGARVAPRKSLVIVESPAKAHTIEQFLGRTFTVRASKGHVRDLPKSQLGVDPEHSFQPKYINIRGKGDTIRELKDAARKARTVILATDPDREGEAISWHLAQILGIGPEEQCRIVFHEVTRDAVNQAIRSPRPIDARLVDAQQARRVLDRLVGYELSPLLWKKIRRGLSAGRVQSVAARLIVDREAQIRAFVPEEYWTVLAELLGGSGVPFTAHFAGFQGIGPEPEGEEEAERPERGRLADRAAVDELLSRIQGEPFVVQRIQVLERRRRPQPPFTTSTLQQEASRRLGFSVKKTMALAQGLYEGEEVPGEGRVGLITYMRTDSTRIADEAAQQAREWITEHYGADHAQPAPQRAHARPGEQGAHEAIRPTAVGRIASTLASTLAPDALKLYHLIWERFVASQMSPAVIDQTRVDIMAGPARFRASGAVVRFPGFLRILAERPARRPRRGEEEREEAEEERALPPLTEGERLELRSITPEQHFTQPPPRYTEASLVRTMEELGIGRPSTYAPTIETILQRGYVVREARRLRPTELGELVVGLLKERFSGIVDPEFTADLERQLDQIEDGEVPWESVVSSFYQPFREDLKRAEAEIGDLTPEPEVTDVVCELCGRPMVVKYGRFGRFLACPGYPECKNTKPYVQSTGAHCPLCGADVVERRSKKGRTFYGCSAYPACSFVSWDPPSGELCPRCGAFLARHRLRGGAVELRCVREGCGYREQKEVEAAT